MADSMPEVKQCDLNTATRLLAHAVGDLCCSLAGAVCNATHDEYWQLSGAKVDGVVSWVFRVAKHKTSSTSGTAAIVINDFEYVTIIRRRQLDLESENELLFILCGRKQSTKLTDKIKKLAPRFGFSSINLTGVRKSAATRATKPEPQRLDHQHPSQNRDNQGGIRISKL